MDQPVIAVLAAAVVAVLTALFGKEAFGRWMLSGQSREDTAVNKMAALLEANAARDAKTVEALMAMLEKALDTVAKQTGALQQIAVGLQGHEQDENLRWSQSREMSERIVREVGRVREAVDDLMRLFTDLALKLLEDRRKEIVGNAEHERGD